MAAAQLCGHSNKITVVNTRTLCGPHRYLVEQAVRWAKEGLNRETIVERLHALMDTAKSFLVPADFDYLRRSGRLSPLVSYVGKAELDLKVLKEAMPDAQFHIYPLSPAFITQGGPGCVAVQYIKM